MTSFIISSHVDRPVAPSWAPADAGCPFCRIIEGTSKAFRVFENERVIAILDILPLRPGHTLVIPKIHCARLSELPAEYAAATGEAVSKVAHALTQASENTALNVVCNQEYAQAVHHVHYHIIPAPTFDAVSKISPLAARASARAAGSPPSHEEMHRREFEAREELDEEEAVELVRKITARL